jgi:hypothetical protein
MPIEWREENGLTFLYVDYRGETTEQNYATFAEQLRLVEASPPGQRLLLQIDPDHRPDSQFLSNVKHAMREVMAPRGTRVAFVGLSGLGLGDGPRAQPRRQRRGRARVPHLGEGARVPRPGLSYSCVRHACRTLTRPPVCSSDRR